MSNSFNFFVSVFTTQYEHESYDRPSGKWVKSFVLKRPESIWIVETLVGILVMLVLMNNFRNLMLAKREGRLSLKGLKNDASKQLRIISKEMLKPCIY